MKHLLKHLIGMDEDPTKYLKLHRLYSFPRRRRALSHGPTEVTIEFTTRCNSRCSYCSRTLLVESGGMKVQDMDAMTFKTMLGGLKSMESMREIILVGWGEAMLHPYFDTMFRKLRASFPGKRMILLTNGLSLPLHEDLLIGSLDQLNISLNTFDRETYRAFNGIDAFDTVMGNIERFLMKKGSRTPSTNIQLFQVDANTQKTVQAFKSYWQPKLNANDFLLFQLLENMAGNIDPAKYVISPKHVDSLPCAQLWCDLSILASGDMYACCQGGGIANPKDGGVYLGDINEVEIDSLSVMARRKKLQDIHRRGRRDEIMICSKCDTWRKSDNALVKIGSRWV